MARGVKRTIGKKAKTSKTVADFIQTHLVRPKEKKRSTGEETSTEVIDLTLDGEEDNKMDGGRMARRSFRSDALPTDETAQIEKKTELEEGGRTGQRSLSSDDLPTDETHLVRPKEKKRSTGEETSTEVINLTLDGEEDNKMDGGRMARRSFRSDDLPTDEAAKIEKKAELEDGGRTEQRSLSSDLPTDEAAKIEKKAEDAPSCNDKVLDLEPKGDASQDELDVVGGATPTQHGLDLTDEVKGESPTPP